jgi:predicted nucleic acid-binding protein
LSDARGQLKVLVLDSGGFGRLSERSTKSLALIQEFREAGLWPPVVPTMVPVESLQGHPARNAPANGFLKTVLTDDDVSVDVARRSAELRRRASRRSAVDALVVAVAEPNGIVLTGDEADINALAAVSKNVAVELI